MTLKKVKSRAQVPKKLRKKKTKKKAVVARVFRPGAIPW
jgi:hypothetical protein